MKREFIIIYLFLGIIAASVIWALVIKPSIDRAALKNCLAETVFEIEKFIQKKKDGEIFLKKEDCYRIYGN